MSKQKRAASTISSKISRYARLNQYYHFMRHFIRHFLSLILTIIIGVSFGQGISYPSIKSKGQRIIDFVPLNWTILDSANGDLNNDSMKDAVVVLQFKDSVALENELGDTVLTQPRILLILFNTHDENNFQLIGQSNSFILKHDQSEMGDPYQKVTISNGMLEIKFQIFYNIGSWYVTNATYKFRFQQGQFVLIGADNFTFNRATHDFEEYSYNFLTKKRSFRKGNDEHGTKNKTWKSINISALKTLKTFIEPFTWEVEEGIYL